MPHSSYTKLLVVLSVLSLVADILSPHTVRASPPTAGGEAKAGIEAVYNTINADFTRRDLSDMMGYFTPDYIEIDEKGARHTKEQTRDGYKKQLDQIKSIQSRYTIQSVTPEAAGTLVEMHLHSEGKGEKRILFAKLHGSFTNDLSVRDLWVDTPQGWRLQHRQTLQNDLKIHPG